MNSHNSDFFHDEPEPEVSSCSPAELAPVELGLDLEFSILEHHLPHKHCTQGFFLNTQAEPWITSNDRAQHAADIRLCAPPSAQLTTGAVARPVVAFPALKGEFIVIISSTHEEGDAGH
jgi:hypothetical protein